MHFQVAEEEEEEDDEEEEEEFDYAVEHWEYCAEGALNIALRYRGELSHLQGRILRVRKHGGGDHHQHDSLEQCNQFVDQVMAPLLGRRFCVRSSVVHFEDQQEGFLAALQHSIDDFRPAKRRAAGGIDLTATCGLLMRDVAKLKSSSICFEIKPKWGFLCGDATRFPCKQRVDRFTMHQHLKQAGSRYCPLDLFSGDQQRMMHALRCLAESPQNNLKLFVDGRQVFQEEDEGSVFAQYCTEEWFEAVVRALLDTGVLASILAAQKLGPVNDIEAVYPVYQRVMTTEAAQAAQARLRLPSLEEAAVSDWAKVQRFLVSCTARDCSVMLTFDGAAAGSTPPPPPPRSVAIVDLDAKPMSKMPHYFALDQEIALKYTSKLLRRQYQRRRRRRREDNNN